MFFDAWLWPQWTMFVIYGLTLAACAVNNGNPKTGTYNFAAQLIGTSIGAFILYAGGFWS